MKRFLVGLMMISFLISNDVEIGRYQLSVSIAVSPKKQKVYVVETVLDTKTGKVTKRKRFYHANYGKKRR
mgnify:CR=1 FL=1